MTNNIEHEQFIHWIEPIDTFEVLYERVVTCRHRGRGLAYRPGQIVGYSILEPEAPACERYRSARFWRRRLWTSRPYGAASLLTRAAYARALNRGG
jgi:hypothetical protein